MPAFGLRGTAAAASLTLAGLLLLLLGDVAGEETQARHVRHVPRLARARGADVDDVRLGDEVLEPDDEDAHLGAVARNVVVVKHAQAVFEGRGDLLLSVVQNAASTSGGSTATTDCRCSTGCHTSSGASTATASCTAATTRRAAAGGRCTAASCSCPSCTARCTRACSPLATSDLRHELLSAVDGVVLRLAQSRADVSCRCGRQHASHVITCGAVEAHR